MKNFTLSLLCVQILLCINLSGSFSDFIHVKPDSRSSQETRAARTSSLDDEIITVQARTGRSYDDDDDDNSSQVSDSGKEKKQPQKTSTSGSSASTAIFGDNDVVFGGQDGSNNGAPSESIADSVDLSISTITEKAKDNKNLSANELKDIALAILKKQEKSVGNRRTLSRQRLEADKKITTTREALERAGQSYQQAVNDAAAVRKLEEDAKGNQERIKNAMQLLYSAIMNDPQIAGEIKEQWEDAKKPGGKLSIWENAFSSCLLL